MRRSISRRKGMTFFVAAFFSLTSVAQTKEKTLHELNQLLIQTVMDDVFTPMVANRIYTYPNIAYYECIRHEDPAFTSLAGKLNGLATIPEPTKNIRIDPSIAAAVAASSLK